MKTNINHLDTLHRLHAFIKSHGFPPSGKRLAVICDTSDGNISNWKKELRSDGLVDYADHRSDTLKITDKGYEAIRDTTPWTSQTPLPLVVVSPEPKVRTRTDLESRVEHLEITGAARFQIIELEEKIRQLQEDSISDGGTLCLLNDRLRTLENPVRRWWQWGKGK